MFVNIPPGAGFKPLFGNLGINVEKDDKFREGEIRVESAGQFFPAGYPLIHQGRNQIAVGNDKLAPFAAAGNSVFSVQVLVTVGREKPGDGCRLQGNFPPQDGTDKAPDGAACRFKRSVKGGEGRSRETGFRKAFRQKPQLGRSPAPVNTLKNGEIVYI
jgi:hypothetical protein